MFDQYVEVVFNRKINPATFLMGLRAPHIAFESRPGQFLMVRINEGIDPLLRRPFSIYGIDNEDNVCILYKTIGHGTEMLSEKRAGEKLSILGPLGQGFILPESDSKAILVAGGIGAAPLYFLAQALKDNPMEFMAGFGSSGDIIPNQQINDRQIKVSIATDDGSEGYSGRVTGLLEEYLDKSTNESGMLTIYSCGPLPMLKKTASIASSRNITCQVSMEALMACGLGACQGCAVNVLRQDNQTHYCHVCKDGPVFSSLVIDWSKV
jgi:dihydroorotate dehydrogenase electron transfer subunit